MSARTLLRRAHSALAGTTALPKGTRARVAAWYARAALEDATATLLEGRLQSDPRRLTMASRLTCLRVLRPDQADEASHAWWALSRVCHQHAFELTPTTAEVAHLIDRVETLVASSPSLIEPSQSLVEPSQSLVEPVETTPKNPMSVGPASVTSTPTI